LKKKNEVEVGGSTTSSSSASSWEDIAKMPPTDHQLVNFISTRVIKEIVYSLSEKTWS
jgi:hypothetical protein